MQSAEEHNDWDEEVPNESKLTVEEVWNVLLQGKQTLKSYFRLWPVVFILMLAVTVLYYMVTPPRYTATAIIGPPNPSPVTAMEANVNGSSGLSGVSKRLLGGSSGGTNDVFQEYQQLLTSWRLANDLVEKDHILPEVYWKRWDADKKQWKPGGAIHAAASGVKRLLNRPVTDHPTVKDLKLFLEKRFSVTAVANNTSLLSLKSSTNYFIISLEFQDRDRAMSLLRTILHRADEIIRAEQQRDVTARISYIENELNRVTQNEQRSAFIDILSGQEQFRIMLAADNLYASTMVDPPYAPIKPTSPGSPAMSFILVFFFSFFAWAGLVLFRSTSPALKRCVEFFRKKTPNENELDF